MKFFEIKGFSKGAIVTAFIIKVAAGTSVWWIYTYYYQGGDIQNYFNDGNKLFQLLIDNPKLFLQVVLNKAPYPELQIWNNTFDSTLYNDARTMSLLNMLFRFFSFGYFHVHTVFMCFLSLIGLTALYKTFVKYLLNHKNKVFIALLFVPSVLFWSSGVLKEGLLFFGLGIFLYSTNCGMPTSYSLKKIFFILISITILLLIKIYVLLALLPGLALNALLNKTSEKFIALKYFSIIIVFAVLAILLGFINPDYNVLNIIRNKQVNSILEARGGVYLENKQKVVCINYNNSLKVLNHISNDTFKIAKGSDYIYWQANDMSRFDSIKESTDTSSYKFDYKIVPAQSILHIDILNANFSNFFIVLPEALFNSIFEPTLWNINSKIQLFPAIENGIIIILIIVALFFINKKPENKSFIIFCISFVIILFVLIGITTPSLGAIVRYKTPALPFLLISLILMTNKKKETSHD